MSDKFYTLHRLVDILTEELKLTPEQQFWVTAKIKRLIHIEKHGVYSRYAEYSDGHPIFEDGVVTGREQPKYPWIHTILSEARDNHKHWSELPDKQMVTWNVGSHKFVQKKPPCSTCEVSLTGIGHQSVYDSSGTKYYCQTCAEALGIWPKDES